MSKILSSVLIAAATAAALASAPAAMAADVGISVQISQPGAYGRVDIGRFPQPQLVVAQPVIVQRPVRTRQSAPVYMWVPPGHRQDWRRHCAAYGACGTPVYFVQDRWYNDHVRPRAGLHGPAGHPQWREARRDDRRDWRDDRRDDRQDARQDRREDRRDRRDDRRDDRRP